MNRSKYYLLVIIFFFASVNIFSQSLSLDESIAIGMKNSDELTISESDVRISEYKIDEISSQMFPRLSFSASYIRLSDIPPFEVNVPFSSSPLTISEPILNNYSFKLSLQQPLFTGFRLSSLKSSAELKYEAGIEIYTAAKNNYALKIVDAFWKYASAIEMKKLIDEELKSLDLHLTDTKNFLENGLVTINDLLKIQVQYSSLELKKIEIENAVELAKINFNRILGLLLNSETIISYEASSEIITRYNVDDLLEAAAENRSELKSLKFKIEAAEENISASQSGWYPSVYLFSNFYYSKPNLRILPAEDKFNETWDVGVSLSWDLWDWGNRSSKVNQAEEIKLQTKSALDQLRDAVETEVYHAYLDYNKTIKKISVAERSVEQAEENLRLIINKYDVQLATSSDLLDAETYLYEAKTNLTNAAIEYNLAKTKLEATIGNKIYR